MKKSPQSQISVCGRNELRLGVDTSVNAADVGVRATTSDTEAQRRSSEPKATTALVAQVPRPAVSVLLPTPVSELPTRKDPGRAEHVAHQPIPRYALHPAGLGRSSLPLPARATHSCRGPLAEDTIGFRGSGSCKNPGKTLTPRVRYHIEPGMTPFGSIGDLACGLTSISLPPGLLLLQGGTTPVWWGWACARAATDETDRARNRRPKGRGAASSGVEPREDRQAGRSLPTGRGGKPRCCMLTAYAEGKV